ncbi:MAG: orotate phosphoribosyltransferase [Promethearchaeota archaeon]|jgi:orotate phosphoribosyltransferase
MSWEQEKYIFYDFIFENNVIGFFDELITLKSGRKSNWYINWRTVAEDVFLLDKVSEFLLLYVKHLKLKPDCFYGVPEGATKLGVITQYKWAFNDKEIKPGKYVLSMGRGKPKDHGALKDRYFLGVPKGNVILVEDTTTTGSSMLKAIDDLADNKVNIIAAIGLSNRNELRDDGDTVEKAIKKKGIQYYAMSNAIDLIPLLNPNPEISHHIIAYFKKYGERDIKL